MSLGEMQACLARLYVDESFRRLCALDPGALREYRLAPDEEQALRTLDRGQLENFARSLRNKRRRRAERAYPITVPCWTPRDGALLRPVLSIARGQHAAAAHLSGCDRFRRVHRGIADGSAGVVPPYARDLARFERLCNLAAVASFATSSSTASSRRSEARSLDPAESRSTRDEPGRLPRR